MHHMVQQNAPQGGKVYYILFFLFLLKKSFCIFFSFPFFLFCSFLSHLYFLRGFVFKFWLCLDFFDSWTWKCHSRQFSTKSRGFQKFILIFQRPNVHRIAHFSRQNGLKIGKKTANFNFFLSQFDLFSPIKHKLMFQFRCHSYLNFALNLWNLIFE